MQNMPRFFYGTSEPPQASPIAVCYLPFIPLSRLTCHPIIFCGVCANFAQDACRRFAGFARNRPATTYNLFAPLKRLCMRHKRTSKDTFFLLVSPSCHTPFRSGCWHSTLNSQLILQPFARNTNITKYHIFFIDDTTCSATRNELQPPCLKPYERQIFT